MSEIKPKKKGVFRFSTENLGDSIIPNKFRKHIHNYLRKAGIESVPYFAFGMMLYVAIIVAFLIDIFILTTPVFSNTDIIAKIIFSIFAIPILYGLIIILLTFIFRVYLDIKIQIKISQMEYYFPEFLNTLALNLRIGNVLDVALENSADKEFGILSEEIKLVVRNIRLGATEEEAINEFRKKYNSDMINDTFELILLSWKKGGNAGTLAERLYDNIKGSIFLKERIIASVTNYRIFLTALATVIGPAMFALTYHLIGLIKRIAGQVADVPKSVALPFQINQVNVNESHFIIFSVMCVILIAVAVAFIISYVKTGQAKQAYKQIIIYSVASFISFQIFLFLLGIFFSFFAV